MPCIEYIFRIEKYESKDIDIKNQSTCRVRSRSRALFSQLKVKYAMPMNDIRTFHETREGTPFVTIMSTINIDW
jgi:hypothetical protein